MDSSIESFRIAVIPYFLRGLQYTYEHWVYLYQDPSLNREEILASIDRLVEQMNGIKGEFHTLLPEPEVDPSWEKVKDILGNAFGDEDLKL